MKRKIIILFQVFLVFATYLGAQTQFRGRVINSVTRMPVENASVILKEYDLQTETDNAGIFKFDDPPTYDFTLSITCDGYTGREFAVTTEHISTVNEFEISPELLNNYFGGIVDEALVDEDSDGLSQEISTLISISNDVFLNSTGFQLSPFRFRSRGYDSRYNQKYINGVVFNDQLRGVFNFASVGALNNMTRNGDVINFHNPSSFSFGSIGGTENINMRAGSFAKGTRVTASYTNRNYYLRGIVSYSTGLMDNGWAFTAAVGGRYADKGNVEGTFYNNIAYALAAERQWKGGVHSLSLVTFGSPVERGSQSASFQEAYDLLGNNLYNPYWGYQNGKIRNSSIVKAYDPTGILSYVWRPDRFTTLTVGFGMHYGRYGRTALNWFAGDPRPDYYRYLPSYYNFNPEITEMWENNDTRITQIDWDKMYYANEYSSRNSDGAAMYLIEERRNNLLEASLNATVSTVMNNNMKLDAGIGLRTSASDQYKTVNDLMGAKFVLDIDKFAEQDFPEESDKKQNDLNKPDRKVIQGSVFGYDYMIYVNSANVWVQNRYTMRNIDFYYGTKLTYTEFRRDGKMRNGRYPDNSYGKSQKHNFVDMAFKTGANYKITGRHLITANASYSTEAPLVGDAYISPRISDKTVPNMKSGRIFSADLNYIFNFPDFNGRVSLFQTNFNDQTQHRSYYHDAERTFVNHVLSGLNTTHRGVEVGAAYKLDKNWSFSFAGTLAEYYYANNPEGTICFENGKSDNISETVYLKNYYVGGMPQAAGTFKVGYFYKYWFLGFYVNGVDRNYIDIASLRRLASNYLTANPNDDTYEAYKILTAQERFSGAITLDLSVGKLLFLRNKSSVTINLSLNNILNDKSIRTGGYEQGRLDLQAPNKFNSKYYYMQGINCYLNIGYKF